MKKLISCSMPFLIEIKNDFMMAVCIAAPVLMGVAFHFAIPFLEDILCDHFAKAQIIAPYYILFDLLLAIMTPTMFCFAGVLTMLEELDLGITRYYFVTPVGRRGYLTSRLFVPAVLATAYGASMLAVFTVAKIDIALIFAFSICGGLMAMICSLIVVALAKNKIEGMALVKLCGLLVVGLPVAYFVDSPIRYIFGILPSFWMAELCITNNYLFLVPAIIVSSLMVWVTYGSFQKKLLS